MESKRHETLARALVRFSAWFDPGKYVFHDESELESKVDEIAYQLGEFDRTSFTKYLQSFIDGEKHLQLYVSDPAAAARARTRATQLMECVLRLNPVYPARVDETKNGLGAVKYFCNDYFGEATDKCDGCADCPLAEVCARITQNGERLADIMDEMCAALSVPDNLQSAQEWFKP